MLFLGVSPLARREAPGEMPSILFRPWRCGGGGGGTMDRRLLGGVVVSAFTLMMDGGRPDMEREEPLDGGGAGSAVGDVEC